MSLFAAGMKADQVVYTMRALAAYDFVVHGISARHIWKCPASRLLQHYDKHVTANHLDVGVGTGYLLDRCRFPSPTPRIALMDVNPDTLKFTSRRIARYRPDVHRLDIREPVSVEGRKFDSVGINYVLHCLPGSIASKGMVFDHLKAVMNPGGVLFGTTLLQKGVRPNWLARRLMDAYVRSGLFSNEDDDPEGLRRALEERFADVSLEVVGCAALFSGRA